MNVWVVDHLLVLAAHAARNAPAPAVSASRPPIPSADLPPRPGIHPPPPAPAQSQAQAGAARHRDQPLSASPRTHLAVPTLILTVVVLAVGHGDLS
jgi:hypothetical protein